ncbi:MAG: hypothetical protein KIT84_16355 [Labilithrix sp.]|nr:hypothetical protein [Labilithrix sp.]MCW5812602.1 hypothetical protein [Labilithrix sp.]
MRTLLAKRTVGLALILHGLAHVALGTAVQDARQGIELVVGTVLFAIATPGFVAAGFGAWNVAGLRHVWGGLVKLGVLASLLLVVISAPSASRSIAAVLGDVLLLAFSDILTAPAEPRRVTT